MQNNSSNHAEAIPRTEVETLSALCVAQATALPGVFPGTVHRHSSDPMFCGSQGTRRFTVDDGQVTCQACLGMAPDCDLCAQPMILQQPVDDADNIAQTECGSPYPQWACFCNGGNYIAA